MSGNSNSFSKPTLIHFNLSVFRYLFFFSRQRHKARLTIGDEVIEITSVSSNEIVIKYKIVYYQIITIIKLIESNMKIIREQPPSEETARLLDVSRVFLR